MAPGLFKDCYPTIGDLIGVAGITASMAAGRSQSSKNTTGNVGGAGSRCSRDCGRMAIDDLPGAPWT